MKQQLENKQVLVVGLARSGLAAAELLLSEGAQVRVTDLRSATQLQPQLEQLQGRVKCTFGGHRESDFTGADLIVVSPGVPSNHPYLAAAREQGVPVWAEVELGFRYLQGDLIGITGSNGKTTTTALVGSLLETAGITSSVAGNIGRPLTEVVLTAPQSRFWVLELSSFQLENIQQLHCRIAAVLNLTADHLDRHQGMEQYIEAKERIFNLQTSRDYAVLNADDPLVSTLAGGRDSEIFWFSRRQTPPQGACVSTDGWISVKRRGQWEKLVPAAEIRLKGAHNLENVLAATAIGHLAGVDAGAMKECFRSFSGVEHRLEYVACINGVEFYNDSKATNVDSALRALEAFDRPLIVILGGRSKGGDFRPLVPILARKVRAALLIGEAAAELEALLSGVVTTQVCPTLESAVDIAHRHARPGEVVVLAPACASFDMFDNYEHRGRVFKDKVHQLGNSPQEVRP